MPKVDTTERLARLRSIMKNTNHVPETINAFIVPTDDAHQNEYVPDCFKRREYISGFTGSAGTAVITDHKAALWTDGRYFLQAEEQLDSNWSLIKARLPGSPRISEWLNSNLPSQSVVGADPATVSNVEWEALEKEFATAGNRLIPIQTNLIDIIWDNRSFLPDNHVMALNVKYAGRDWKNKVADIRMKMVGKKADYLVVTALDEIAWLLNLRGSDIPYNPVFFAYVVVSRQDIVFFVNETKLVPSVREHLDLVSNDSMETDMRVRVLPYGEIFHFLQNVTHQEPSCRIWVSPESSRAIVLSIQPRNLISETTPIVLMKSIKNEVELQGLVNAHIRDGVALAEFFAWLENEVPKGNVTELSASAKLLELRSAQENFVSLSFDTISGSGPNGAIIHYKPTTESNRNVTSGDMFLLDSGSQYLDGTTDVTRTIHLGSPTDYQKECYTRVLKGNIAVAMMKFPEKTTGARLDSFARAALWKVGLDFGHGTGHGVGCFLNVHEGPMSISFRYNPNDPGLVAGQIVTDEPGYYEANAFGIRIEDQMVVEKVTLPYAGKATFLGLRSMTLAPYSTKLIVRELLTKEEVDYIDAHHANCLSVVGKILQEQGKSDAYRWLVRETMPLG